MGMESLSPELAYATKGNIDYPQSGGVDGTQTAASLAALAQRRLADATTSPQNAAYGVITTALAAGTAYTSIAVAGGLVGNIPSGAIVAVLANNQVQTYTTSAAAAAGATSVAVTSETSGFAVPVGSELVYGTVAATVGPGPTLTTN